MTIQQILANQSQWTWNMMLLSSDLGEMIREDALTSVNLATIHGLAHAENIALNTASFQGAHLEKEFGGDWMWRLGQAAYLIQAKRLDVIKRIDKLSYLIDIPQLKQLIDTATALSLQQNVDTKPVYVFYNSMIPGERGDLMGCTFLNAYVLGAYLEKKGLLNQGTVTLFFQTVQQDLTPQPWFTMFG